MTQSLPHRILMVIALAGLFTILLVSFALAAPAGLTSPYASAELNGAPAKVSFETTGLPAGVTLTITGTYTNNGGKDPVGYSMTFSSPGPSGAVASEPYTELDYSEFPANFTFGANTYTLLSTIPASPFTVGAPGSTIPVVATYGLCSAISIDTQPADLTAEVGAPATFSVAVTGQLPAYQWRRNEVDIPGANSSSYTISSVGWSDHGDVFDVVVTNGCSSVQSEEATLTVSRKSQAIDFSQPDTPKAYQASFDVSATSTSGLPVAFTVNGGCSLEGSTVTMTSGTTACVITAKQGGNSEFSAAPDVVRTVNAAKLDQAIDFSEPASPQTYGDKFSVSPTSDSSLAVSVNASGSCSYASGEVTMTGGTGDCILTASQAGDENYNPAGEVSWTVAAAKAGQAITFAAPASPQTYGTQFSVSPTSTSNLVVSVDASGSCSYAAGKVTMTSGTGDCTLTASQAGDANYNPAPNITRTVAAVKANQVITFAQPVSPVGAGSSFEISPTADSGLAVSVIATGACSLSDETVTASLTPGACTLTASQPGNAFYNAAPTVARTVEVKFKSGQVFFPILYSR